MGIEKEVFGTTPDGKEAYLFKLANAKGLKAKIISYGAILVSLEVPDKQGDFADITLGYDSLAEYINDTCAFERAELVAGRS